MKGMDKQMTVKKKSDFLCDDFIFYLAGILIVLGIKCYYSRADCDSLRWILAPTTWWVGFLSRIPFTYISGTGYVNHDLRLLIAPSCSGVRFMVITFATIFFSFVHMIALPQKSVLSDSAENLWGNSVTPVFGNVKAKRNGHIKESAEKRTEENVVKSIKVKLKKKVKKNTHIRKRVKGLGWLVVSALLSWLFTVLVNGLRIMIAIYLPMYLENAGLMKGVLTQDRLHTMIGVVVYLISLLTIYRLIGWFVRRTVENDFMDGGDNMGTHESADNDTDTCGKPSLLTFMCKCAPPVFWYFVLTLGLPFLSRAGRDGTAEFTEFAVLVTGCCGFLLLPYVTMTLLCGKKHERNIRRRAAKSSSGNPEKQYDTGKTSC